MWRRAFPGSSKVCQISQINWRRQSSAIIGGRISVEDAVIVILTFCPVLNDLKSAHFKNSVMFCYCGAKTLNYTQEAWVSAEKAALISPGMDGRKCSWEWLLPSHPGLVSFEESFVGDGELFSSSLRVYFVTWLLLGGHCCKKEAVSQAPPLLFPLTS